MWLIWLLIVTDFSPSSISKTSRSCLFLFSAQNHPGALLSSCIISFLLFLFWGHGVELGIEPRALYMLSKLSTIEQ